MIKDRAEAIKYLRSINDSSLTDVFRFILNFFRVSEDFEGTILNCQFNNLLLIKKDNVLYYSVIYTPIQGLTLIIKEPVIQELVNKERIERFNEQYKAEYKNGELRVSIRNIEVISNLLYFLF